MSDRLSARQLANLVRLFNVKLASTDLPYPEAGELELGYTSRVLRPLVEDWLPTLRRPELIIRGDGGVNPPRALVVGSLTFYPDVEIVATGARYLAVEVKFLRTGQDPTGAFAKALGQATLYRELGFASSHAVILDLRPLPVVPVPAIPEWHELEAAGIYVHWFTYRAGASGQRLACANRSSDSS